jgi:peptidoglycan/LPS O-acetylase OafA/YrhL
MTYGAIVAFSWLLMAVPNFKKTRNAIEAKPLTFLGDISFGVYAFHWPIFCSLGCYIVIKLWHPIGCTSSVILAIVVSTFAAILISVGFYYAIERPIGKLLTKLKDFLAKFAYRTKAS